MMLRELIEDRGVLPTQLADAMGVSPGAVTKWLYGRSYPSADKLPRLADLLHCTIDDLYGRASPGSAEREESTYDQ